MTKNNRLGTFWSLQPEEAYVLLQSSAKGLDDTDTRLKKNKQPHYNKAWHHFASLWLLLLRQFKSPLTLMLLAAAIISFYLKDRADAYIILVIVVISGLLGFVQEAGASAALDKLMAMVNITAVVLRAGNEKSVRINQVVSGDIVLLNAGDIVPCDGLIVESNNLFADESSLTGETFPAEKTTGVLPANTSLSKRANSVFMGSHIVSGTARVIAVKVGDQSIFGGLSGRLKSTPPETDFEKGVRRFGYMLMELTLLLILVILAANLLLKKPVLDSLLFSLAIAVGLTPQLLPAIISINLAKGAKKMATAKVVVKKLSAIENFGSMNVLCSDKTGTLTTGKVQIAASYDACGAPCSSALLYACINATLQKGFNNPLDEAFGALSLPEVKHYTLLSEMPYDFIRKRLTVVATGNGQQVMISKGAVAKITEVCSDAFVQGKENIPIDVARQMIEARAAEFSSAGYRVLAIATRKITDLDEPGPLQENNMTFVGFVTLTDPPKNGIAETIAALANKGVSLKVITGDSAAVAHHTCKLLGINSPNILTGSDLRVMSDTALVQKAPSINIFAEIEPNQKEQIILSLKKAGYVVGYMGDGINDVTALHAADVGISVSTAVDVAKEAANIVLMDNDLEVLLNGVMEGRITFANTLKYIFMATSANFGNMFSMSAASVFLPFLPLLPRQILLTNLLTDFPEMAIATDNVDCQLVELPRRWNIAFIKKFMVTFGLLSSLFDCITFLVLLKILHVDEAAFQTGWFIESVVSATLVVLVVRTRHFFIRSKPGKYLMASTFAIIAAIAVMPMLGISKAFGFVSLPLYYYVILALIVVTYIAAAECMKKIFYKYIYTK